jgi:hypothetical protein
MVNKALADRIEANRKEYYRLLNDCNYTNVRFNEKTGGLAAIHREHNFDPTVGIFGIPRGDYERISLDVLYEYGNSVILGSEKLGRKTKIAEGYLNEKLFEIKAIEGNSENNIIKDIKDASKKHAEIIVLYYHDKSLFSEKQIRKSYQSYLRNSTSKRIQHVYYIIDKKLYTLYK